MCMSDNAITIMLSRIETLVTENNNLKQAVEMLKDNVIQQENSLYDRDDLINQLRAELNQVKAELATLKKVSDKFVGSTANWESLAVEVCNGYNNAVDKRINMIKDFRKLTGCSLREAKDLIDKIVPWSEFGGAI